MSTILPAFLCVFTAMWWAAPSNAQETDLLPDPTSVEMSDTASASSLRLGMKSCANRETISGDFNIVCFFVLSRTERSKDYTIKDLNKWKPRLIDNLGIEHDFVAVYFLNRRGQQQEKVHLSEGDGVWFATEFADGGSKDITSARVLFVIGTYRPELDAPVTPVE